MELLVRLAVGLVLLLILQDHCGAQGPGPATDLSVQFMEDTDLLQHAVLDFRWTPPPGSYTQLISTMPTRDRRMLASDSVGTLKN